MLFIDMLLFNFLNEFFFFEEMARTILKNLLETIPVLFCSLFFTEDTVYDFFF